MHLFGSESLGMAFSPVSRDVHGNIKVRYLLTLPWSNIKVINLSETF